MIDPREQYLALFAEEPLSALQGVAKQDLQQLQDALEQFIFRPLDFAGYSVDQQMEFLRNIWREFCLLELSVGEKIIRLAEWLALYGGSPLSSSPAKLMNMDEIIGLSESYLRAKLQEANPSGDTIDLYRKILKCETHLMEPFLEFRKQLLGVLDKKKEYEAMEEEKKVLEKKIRDVNGQIKGLHQKIFQIDDKEASESPYGGTEELTIKIQKIQSTLDHKPDLSEDDRNKLLIHLQMLEDHLAIYDHNEYVERSKEEMKARVKNWGEEVKGIRETLKEMEDECQVELVLERRKTLFQEALEGQDIVKAFISQSAKDGDFANLVDSEMISVGAAARLAEAMKGQMPTSFVMNAPSMPTPNINITNSSGSDREVAEAPAPINRPIKPDIDFTNRDKDRLIQLIYESDDRGIRFEKSAETLEALAYKSPSKAAQILLEQNVTDRSFFLH